MNDRELLELAAKAAGMNGEYVEHFGEVGIARNRTGIWNPLEDDGDALRLAVKLKFEICIEDYAISVRTHCGNKIIENSTMGYGIEEATRRAIVRAAAEIGKEIGE